MALERENAPFHVSHWGVEDTSINHDQTLGSLSGNDSPSKDSVMSDATTSASAVDVQMILGHDSPSTKGPLGLPTVDVPLGVTPGNELDGGQLPDAPFGVASPHQLTNTTNEPQQIVSDTKSPMMLTPSTIFTPRRSPRASTSASKSRENSVMREATPKMEQPRIPQYIQAPAFREGFISSAMPSPSLFQATEVVMSSETDLLDSRTTEDVQGYAGLGNSADHRARLPSPSGMDVNMDKIDGKYALHYQETADTSLDSSPVVRSFFTPLSHSNAPSGLQFPSSSADLSAIFASPVPQLSQPVLSPFRLHQDFKSFSMPQAPAESSSTPPPVTPSAVETDVTPMKSGFDTSPNGLGSPTALPQGLNTHQAPLAMPQSTKNPQIQGETGDNHEDLVMGEIETGANTEPFLSFNMTPPRSPKVGRGSKNSASQAPPTPSLQGSLTPSIKPRSTAQLPFPITPQRGSQAEFFTPVRSQPNLFAPIGNNPQPFTSFPHASSHTDTAHTPSRIPVSVSTPVRTSSDVHPPLGSTAANTESVLPSSLLSPPTTSQLRQPSNLRNTTNGAASKIPRPGKKPYAKPISRLPKPKATGVASPVNSVASSKPSTISTPMSPIKTRRGRANQAAGSSIAQVLSAPGELPPGAIIYAPPAPRIRPKFDNQEIIPISDEDAISKEINDEAISPRASPPIETGLSPPKSGVFLKSESRRLKAEAATTPATSSVIPHFTATAPSLGIFPSLSRAKGKGKNTLIRPMMMPLDPTSLRNLTTSNTLHNQHYVCSKVETQVILKEGKRPASPTSKVKTILEKKKEGQEKSREERAARRVGKLAAANGQDQEMADPSIRKHPRGAGEDEDYETPVKPARDTDMEDDQKRKRVKWDKDLLQRFELDETNLEGIRKAAELAKARAATKGCLAAQVLLDPLGNVPQADIPIPNLPKEQVVVTRLVYIEDLPPSERPKRVAATKANARIGMT